MTNRIIDSFICFISPLNSKSRFLRKTNGILELVTNLDIERQIITKADKKLSRPSISGSDTNLKGSADAVTTSHPLYLRILEKSKAIQVQLIREKIKQIKVGYLFGVGTISFEAVDGFFRGEHVAFPNVDELYAALEKGYLCTSLCSFI